MRAAIALAGDGMVDLAATTGGRLRYQWTQGNLAGLAGLADLLGVRVCRGAVNG